MSKVVLCPLPAGSRILLAEPGADFSDSYRLASLKPEASALAQFLALIARTPAWMNFLMMLRNQAVRWVGLKNLGGMAVGDPRKPASRRLSDLGVDGCEPTAAVHLAPSFCPIAGLWGCKSGTNCPGWGRFSLSPPQVRQPPSYRPGDRVGIFTLQYVDFNEVILEDRDKHLHVQVSLFRLGQNEIQISTVVHNLNRLGRAYMSVVGPVHGLIVPMMLRQVGDVH